MSDITTFWDPVNLRGDWQLLNGALASGDDLQTGVIISIFSDQVAGPDDVIPDGSGDPRGWCGDEGETIPIGSKIWLRLPSVLTQAVANQIQDDLQDCLAWMPLDGVCATVQAFTQIVPPNQLDASVVITRGDGTSRTFKFPNLWKGL